MAGDLPARRARRIAQATNGLSREAASYVDQHVAAFAHRLGPAALDRLVVEAIARFMPAEVQAAAERAADRRHLDIHHDRVSFDGTSRIEGELDLADALDLEDALQREARSLAAAGCDASLDVRRSMAAGQIARRQLALDLAEAEAPADQAGVDEAGDGAGSTSARRSTRPRQVVLYVHLSDAAARGGSAGLDVARVENHQQVLTADQVRTWCANPDTAVTVKPVIDLNEHRHTEAYEVPDRLREQAELRDRTCVFPWCTRAARRCECDHVIPFGSGGPTCGCNIAPLCRRHHRLKTHSSWTYTVLEPGAYLWSSPHGYQFLVDPDGTLDVSRDRSTGRPRRRPEPPCPTDPPEH